MYAERIPASRASRLTLQFLVLILSFSAQANAALPAQGLIVDAADGAAKIRFENLWQTPYAGMAVRLPAVVSTGADGSVRLREGETVISIAANSAIELTTGPAPGQLVQRVVQDKGSAFYDVAPQGSHRFRVESPYLVAVVKGTQFNVTVAAETSTIALFEGHLQIDAPEVGDSVELFTGQIARRHRGAARISILSMDDGNVASRSSSSDATPGNGPGSPGGGATGDIDTVAAGAGGLAGTGGNGTIADGSASGDASIAVVLDSSAGVADVVDAFDTGPAIEPGVGIDTELVLGADEIDTGLDIEPGPVNEAVDIGLGADIDLADGGIDVGIDARVDVDIVTLDAGVAADIDLAGGIVDVGVDAGIDTDLVTVDAGIDAGLDLAAGTVDAGLDAGIDTGMLAVDAGIDAGLDLGGGALDLGVDSGIDLGGATVDTGVDVGLDLDGGTAAVVVDTDVDLGVASVDTGIDAGVGLDDGSIVVDAGTEVSLGGADIDASVGADVAAGDVDVSVGVAGIDLDIGLGLGSGDGLLNLDLGGDSTDDADTAEDDADVGTDRSLLPDLGRFLGL